jgi:hypothetical protein
MILEQYLHDCCSITVDICSLQTSGPHSFHDINRGCNLPGLAGSQAIFPDCTLDGMIILRCFFCKTFQTPIEYDMRIDLQNTHRMELGTKDAARIL